MKKCCKCHKLLPVTEFYSASGRKDNLGTACKTCCREYSREQYWKNPREFSRRSNERYRFYTYGLNVEGYESLWAKSSSCSSLSGRKLVRGRGKINSGHVDHYVDIDGSPVVRGLLSSKENTALGLLDHNPALFWKSMMYLLKHHPVSEVS